ncbi:MAG: bifunctional serine/threonine-protein kinase/formylglycine-generating enzyme family protein [Anaerolineae bacterium]
MITPRQILQNRYQIVRPLGSGGMGAVYLAQDLRLQRAVAVKENLGGDLRLFQQEALLLARLSHPGLPEVYDHFVEPNGAQYLVMKFIEGENLDELGRRVGPLPAAHVLGWIDQVLDALTYLHTRQPPVIHRDIKPANIKITPQGQAVLVDFGIAKMSSLGMNTLTGARGAGTPGYAPPEQYAQHTDPRSDIYALGATLYAALTDQVPPESTLRLVNVVTLTPPRQIVPTLSPQVESVILQAMETDITRRWQQASDLRAALQMPATQQTPLPAQRPPPPVQRPIPAPVVVTQPVPPISLMLELARGVTLELVRVPAGEFLMGSKADMQVSSDEKPQHKVYLDEYLIGKYPVTVAQFAAFVQATGHKVAVGDAQHKANHPVVNVSWDDVVAFCKWASQVTGRAVRLSTEAEWEKAARGTDGRIYPWGNTFDQNLLNSAEGRKRDTTLVGSYPKGVSPYGALDMAGNVWEWCADWFAKDYYENSPAQNPTGPNVGSYRVVRGGSFDFLQYGARCALRGNSDPGNLDNSLGFRVAASLARF